MLITGTCQHCDERPPVHVVTLHGRVVFWCDDCLELMLVERHAVTTGWLTDFVYPDSTVRHRHDMMLFKGPRRQTTMEVTPEKETNHGE